MDNRPAGHTVNDAAARRRPAHSARPAPAPRRLVAGVLGAAAALTAMGLGAAACLATLGPSTSTPSSAQSITVAPTTGTAVSTAVSPP